MWNLYATAKNSRSRPSDLVDIADRWAAYQFDRAVSFVGNVIEGASQEMQEIGTGKNKKMVPKYRMDQLLDPDFKLPRPKTAMEHERENVNAFAAMIRAASRDGRVKIDKVKAG